MLPGFEQFNFLKHDLKKLVKQCANAYWIIKFDWNFIANLEKNQAFFALSFCVTLSTKWNEIQNKLVAFFIFCNGKELHIGLSRERALRLRDYGALVDCLFMRRAPSALTFSTGWWTTARWTMRCFFWADSAMFTQRLSQRKLAGEHLLCCWEWKIEDKLIYFGPAPKIKKSVGEREKRSSMQITEATSSSSLLPLLLQKFPPSLLGADEKKSLPARALSSAHLSSQPDTRDACRSV